MSDPRSITVHLAAADRASWLVSHDPAFDTSTISIAGEVAKHPVPLTIVGVLGLQWKAFRVVNPTTLIVSPGLRPIDGHLTILCEAPYSPVVDRRAITPGTPRPNESYGLQRAVVRPSRDQA